MLKLAERHRGEAIVARRQNVLWKFDLQSPTHRQLYYLSMYEARDTSWLRRQIRPDWVFLDIGANFGYYSMLVSEVTHGAAEVYAFEPLASVAELLEEHRRMNGFENIHIHRTAISDSEGEITLVYPSDENNILSRMLAEGEDAEGKVERAQTIRLDTFVRDHNINRVDFIKIDVEGAEPFVLNGAAETIQRFRPTMMIEIHPQALELLGSSAAELFEKIYALGYDTYRIGWTGMHPLRPTDDILPFVNAICIPKR
jgi:FkbM family methyltransferase